MNKPNRNLDLTKTNYWANLKRKTTCKDEKEHEKFNKEVLNCISILEGRIIKLEQYVDTIASKIVEDMELQSNINDSIKRVIIDGISPEIEAIEEAVGREKIREVFERLKEEEKIEASENGESEEN